MIITGIIAEYDPLHAGHIYQMSAARKNTGADYVVCVMDGAFTQRGEPALMDKYARVRMALVGGADAVIELPQVYAVRPAQIFARGGIDILRAIGADFVCFGSETDDEELIRRTARIMLEEPPEVSRRIKEGLAAGKSYPRALGEALENPYIESPNFILGLEYTKRITETGSAMKISAVKRTDDYHSGGASNVRRLIRAGETDAAVCGLPHEISALYTNEIANGGLCAYNPLDSLILDRLRNLDMSVTYPDDAEGLLERIVKLSRSAVGCEELIESVKCKRYTRARIVRLIANAVTKLPEAPAEIPYIRLLGMRRSAGGLLKELDRRSGGRLVSSAALLRDEPCFAAECRATDIWGLGTQNPVYRRYGREFTQKFITI